MCIRDSISGDMKAAVGHVGNQESALRSAANSADMVQHFIQRDGQSAVVTKHNHAERVADEEYFHTGFVKQTRSGVVVSLSLIHIYCWRTRNLKLSNRTAPGELRIF